MFLLDNWLVIPLILLLNTFRLGRWTQVIGCLLAGIALAVLPVLLNTENPWFLVFATTANNVVVLIVLAVAFEFLWRRFKWAAIIIVVIGGLLLGRTSDGRTLLALTMFGLFAVVERWRLLPPFRSVSGRGATGASTPTDSGDRSSAGGDRPSS